MKYFFQSFLKSNESKHYELQFMYEIGKVKVYICFFFSESGTILMLKISRINYLLT